MSEFSDNLIDGARFMLTSMGEVVYWEHPNNQDTGTATMIVEPETRSQRDDDRGMVNHRERVFAGLTADIGEAVTLRLRFRIADTDEWWQVEAIEQSSPTWTRFRCVYIGRADFVRPGMRRP